MCLPVFELKDPRSVNITPSLLSKAGGYRTLEDGISMLGLNTISMHDS